LQANIPLKNVRVLRERPRDQSSAATNGNEIQNMICRVRWIIREVEPRNQAAEQTPHEHGDFEMWRLRTIIGAGNAARLDGGEGELAAVVGGHAAEAEKSLRRRFLLRIFRLGIFAVSIGLPNFEASVRNGLTLAIGCVRES